MQIKFSFLIFLAFPYIIIAQNLEPAQREFNINSLSPQPIQISSSIDYFRESRFIKGNHWDNSPRLGRVLGYNQLDIYSSTVPLGMYDSTQLFVKLARQYGSVWKHLYTHTDGMDILNARGIQYSPVLLIDTTKTDQLQTVENDPLNPVFGFAYIRGRPVEFPNEEMRNKLVIDGDSLINQIILQEPWVANELKYTGVRGIGDLRPIDIDYLCRGMYVTINLRRLGIDSTLDTAHVLKIEVPHEFISETSEWGEYATYSDGGNLFIDSVPQPLDAGTHFFPFGRGRSLSLVESPTRPDHFIIRRNMLPNNNEDITISAFMFLDENARDGKKNRFLSRFKEINSISKLKLKITYLGNAEIAINYIRFETPQTKRLLSGRDDDTIASYTQFALNSFITDNFISRGIKLSRINTHIEGGVQQWIGERYVRKLIGDIITGETEPYYPHLYEHYVNSADRWFGLQNGTPSVSVPYFDIQLEQGDPNNLSHWRTFGYFCGFRGVSRTTDVNLLINSHYETELRSNATPIETKTMSMQEYLRWENCTFSYGWFSPLAYWEFRILRNYANPQNNSYIYSNKNWFSQTFILHYWDSIIVEGNVRYFLRNQHRGLTGEEFRLYNFNPIIMGAKGLIYDGAEDMKDRRNPFQWRFTRLFWETDTIRTIYQGNLNNTDDQVLLNDPRIGSDYLQEVEYMPFTNGNRIDYNILEANLGVPRNRIYMGRLSNRRELRRINEWVSSNEETLMNLKLQAWFGKGYKDWYNQHPKYSQQNIMQNFIDVDEIQTNKVISYAINGNDITITPNIVSENKDSSFYDITLLAHNTDTTMTKMFYLGIQNRRTDPLVVLSPDDTSSINTNSGEFRSGFNFIPTARYDELVDGPDSNFWRSKWLTRLGTRQIVLPFNYSNPQSPTSEHILHVTELRDSSSFSSNWAWWRQEKWKRGIDTIISASSRIELTLLPGEGKILKVEVLPKIKFSGELPYSAQNKMVVYPTKQQHQKDFSYKDTSVYYHITYQKYDTVQQAYNIYYRRSMPTSANHRGTNIIWEPNEYQISKIRRITNAVEPGIETEIYEGMQQGCDCKYPTILVRYDSIAAEAMTYIVYNCRRIMSADSMKNYIVETVFPANYIGAPTIPDTSNVIAFAYRGNTDDSLKRWGVPTINGSYSMNYYAWADSIRGIMVGVKTPHDREPITNQNGIIVNDFVNKSLHPNLNTYSRMQVNEETCSIVWQAEGPINNYIYYTRLREQNGVIIPSIYRDAIDTSEQNFKKALRMPAWAPTKALINYPYQGLRPSFPSVHRNISYKLRTGSEAEDSIHFAKNCWDRIAWMYGDEIEIDNYLGIKAVDYSDSLQRENYLPTSYIHSINNKLIHPFLTQGNISYESGQFHDMIGSDSSIVLFFSEKSNSNILNVYQFNMSFWSLFQYPTNWNWGTRNLVIQNTDSVNQSYVHFYGNGMYPHPSSSPVTNKQQDFWLTRGVYQNEDLMIEGASPKLSFKGTENQKVVKYFIGFSSPDSSQSSSISPFYTDDGKEIPLMYGVFNNEGKLKVYDTLQTDWFKISELKKIGFNFHSLYAKTMSLYLQRQEDGKIFSLTPYLQSRKVKKNIFTFLNGKNKKYRLLATKNNSLNSLVQHIIIGYESEFVSKNNLEGDEQNYKFASEAPHIINLGPDEYDANKINIEVYPIPVRDELYFVAYLPSTELKLNPYSQLNIKIYSLLGEEKFSTVVNSGDVHKINTSFLPKGGYILRAIFYGSDNHNYIENKNLIIE